MEWMEVVYPEDREVFIAGLETPCGRTNRKVPIGEGTHTFHLGDPDDYEPPTVQVSISGTTEMQPCIVRAFQPKVT